MDSCDLHLCCNSNNQFFFFTNDFCLDNGIEGAFALYQGNGSMVAQDLKHLQYIIHTEMVGEQ